MLFNEISILLEKKDHVQFHVIRVHISFIWLSALISTIRYDFDQYWFFPPSTVHGYTEMILMNLCRRRFHVNSIFSSSRGSFNFSVSPSPYENNEDMKTQRDIQRLKTQSRYRWTKNSDKQCHVPSSFRERIENSWRFNVSWHDSLIWKQESILWIDMLSPTFARWRDVNFRVITIMTNG